MLTKSEVMACLAPRERVELVINIDLNREKAEVRSTLIHDHDDGRLLLHQTDPPMLKSTTGRPVEVTFVYFDREANQGKRLGYLTEIREFIPHHSDQPVSETEYFIAVDAPVKAPLESSLRLHYRVAPMAHHNVTVKVQGAPAEATAVVDMSVGGLLISAPINTSLELTKPIYLTLSLDGTELTMMALVVRTFERSRTNRFYAGLKFLDLTRQARQAIQATVNQVMRDELKARSGLKIGR